MFDGKKPFVLNRAHKMAVNLDKPYVYLCADIRKSHPFSYDAVKRTAVVVDEVDGSLYFLGPHEECLKQFAIYHFASNGFQYSAMNVDGLRTNGDINVGLWLTKPDLVANRQRYEEVLSDVSIIEVLRQTTWEKLHEASNDEEFNTSRELARLMGRDVPHFMFAIYQISFNGKMIPKTGPDKHVIMGPELFEFYGGKPAPDVYASMFKEARTNPERIREGRARLLSGK